MSRRLKHSADSVAGAVLFWGTAILFTIWLVGHIASSDNPAFNDVRIEYLLRGY